MKANMFKALLGSKQKMPPYFYIIKRLKLYVTVTFDLFFTIDLCIIINPSRTKVWCKC